MEMNNVPVVRTDMICLEALVNLAKEEGNDLYAERLEEYCKLNAEKLELGVPYIKTSIGEDGNLIATSNKPVDNENKKKAIKANSVNKKLADAFFGTGQVSVGDFLLECKNSILTKEKYSIDFNFEEEHKLVMATKDPRLLSAGAKRLVVALGKNFNQGIRITYLLGMSVGLFRDGTRESWEATAEKFEWGMTKLKNSYRLYKFIDQYQRFLMCTVSVSALINQVLLFIVLSILFVSLNLLFDTCL